MSLKTEFPRRPPLDVEAFVAAVKADDPYKRGQCRLHGFYGEATAAKGGHTGLCGACYMFLYRKHARVLGLLPAGQVGRPRKQAA